MFEQASHFTISGSTFVNNETTNITNNGIDAGVLGIDYLYRFVASGASHDSKDQYENPKCHPDTRKQLLSDIHEWIKVPDKETGILFLHGPAGAGKSCIARSACEQAARDGLLGASFFFWRGSPVRNNENRFIATLAYQLATGNKELGSHISREIRENSRVIEIPLEVQFRKLILEPCSKVPRENLHIRAIVIDGLDECIGEQAQTGILEILARAVRHEGFPLGFFVTSRPELHLQEALDCKEVIFATNVISLNWISGVSQDIRTVLESGFVRILNNPRFKRAFKSISRPWPTTNIIDKLVRDSSGQFIYAETVLKFVSDPDNNPVSQLKIVLCIQDNEGDSTESPLFNLDRLYSQIMSGVRHPERTVKVLGYLIAINELRCQEMFGDLKITQAVQYNQNRLFLVVEQLLGLSDGMAFLALNQLHSLISLHAGAESTRRNLAVTFYHKSFREFLTTQCRSTVFYVDLKDVHADIAQSCLKLLGVLKHETEAQHVGWIYSLLQWDAHNDLSKQRIVNTSAYHSVLKNALSKSSKSSYYLHFPTLHRALQTLGLLGKSKVNGIPNQKLVSVYAVTYVRYELRKCRLDVQCSFDILHAYPTWLKFLQSYNNDPLIKQLLIFHLLTTQRYPYLMSDSEICKLFQELGLITIEQERISIPSLYTELTARVKVFMGADETIYFLETAEYSGPFHCKAEDYSDVFTAIISSGLWRNYLFALCFSWDLNPITVGTGPLLAYLMSEALEFHDNIELNKKLNINFKPYFFRFLRENYRDQHTI